MNPANSPTKIPTIKMPFVLCFLPELYIIIETYIKAPHAIDRNSIEATLEVHKLPTMVPTNVGPPPINPSKSKKCTLGLFVTPVRGPAIPNPSVAL